MFLGFLIYQSNTMEFAVCFGGLDNPQATTNILLENGVRIIETGPDFFLNSDDDKIEGVAKEFLSKGIAIRSVHAPFGGDNSLSVIDDSKRKKSVRMHKELLYKVSRANVEMIIIHPGTDARTKEEIDSMNILALDSISRLVAAAEETGVSLALENMLPGHPGCEIEHITNIIDQISSPSLGICFDSGHAHVCGRMKEYMEAFSEHIISIHAQDNDGTRDMHLQPPYGTTDWRAFASVLQEMNYDKPITIEAEPWGGAGLKQMLREVSALLESALAPDEWQGDNANIALRCLKCGHNIFRYNEQWFCNCVYA